MERDGLAEKIARLVAEQLKGPAKVGPTLAEFTQQFLREENGKPSTISIHRVRLYRHVLPMIGEMRLSAIGRPELELIEVPPRVRKLKCPDPHVRSLTAEAYEAVVSGTARKPALHAAVLLAGDAGLRQGEILALQWSDVCLSAAEVTVSATWWKRERHVPKNGRSRTVPLSARLAAALHAADHDTEWVIEHYRDPDSLLSALASACEAAGLPHVTYHPLRHTFATLLDRRGAGLADIRDLLGHRSISQTSRYLASCRDSQRSAVALLGPRPPEE